MAHARIEATVSDYRAEVEYWTLEVLLDLDGGLPEDEQELSEPSLEAGRVRPLPIHCERDYCVRAWCWDPKKQTMDAAAARIEALRDGRRPS